MRLSHGPMFPCAGPAAFGGRLETVETVETLETRETLETVETRDTQMPSRVEFDNYKASYFLV
jgi:hypothetical protein